MMTFGSLFAGIGGFDKGFHDAGMRCAWQVEIDSAARSVLARHWPDVPRFADIRDCGAHNLGSVDVICGGFPCQDLSVAGRRTGLAGARSGLFYEMTRIADELRPTLFVFENVPGLLSSDGGRDFGRVLVELERIGYSGCWTTLDAQFFGVAQRRRRVFGVFAHRGVGSAVCAEILSLAARLPWNTEKGRAARAGVAAAVAASAGHHGRSSPRGDGSDNLVAYALNSHAGAADADVSNRNHANGGPVSMGISEGLAFSLREGRTQNVAFGGNDTRGERAGDSALTNPGNGGRAHSRQIAGGFGVRRLTPTECERLQGFDDGWTDGQADSTRYRQLGNAIAVPVARWIGRRIVEVME